MGKDKVYHRLYIDLGKGYNVHVKDIVGSSLLKPDDQLVRTYTNLVKDTGMFGSTDPDGEEATHIFLEVVRWEDETDDEYSQRMKREARQEEEREKKDWEEYLRLKAKYEK